MNKQELIKAIDKAKKEHTKWLEIVMSKDKSDKTLAKEALLKVSDLLIMLSFKLYELNKEQTK